MFKRASAKTYSLTIAMLVFATMAFAQNFTVKGRVTEENGTPISGASVIIKGAGKGTSTDATGTFSISVAKGASLIISAVNHSPKEIKINSEADVSISLTTTSNTLTDVVVVGYGTQRKIDVTGAVSRVNLESMANAPNTNIGQFLQGTVPGLNVGLSTFAGGTPPISIRGRVTLNGSQNVLIILDGIQYTQSLSSINPDDIASIDILKDASATAVYGAQGANGVILITSRKGRAGQKTRVAFSSAYTTQEPTVNFRPWNREQFLENMKDAFWNEAFIGPDYTQPNPAFNVTPKLDGSMRPGGVMLQKLVL